MLISLNIENYLTHQNILFYEKFEKTESIFLEKK